MGTIIFWGAGKIGKRMLDIWRHFGVQPDFFADNSPKLWGTWHDGIQVLSIHEVQCLEKKQILITCNEIESISSRLMEYGINRKDIYKGNTLNDMLVFLVSHMKKRLKWDIMREEDKLEQKSAFKVLFDVQYGFCLGGVEAWVLQMSDELSAQNIKVKFITTDIKGWTNEKNDDRIIHLEYRKDVSEIDKLIKCLNEIRNNTPCNIICNFTDYTFYSACIAKALWQKEVNLIAVIHSDDKIYYECYGKMQEVIDYCLVTCDKMEERLIRCGIAKQKILRLAWKFPCEDVMERKYSEMGQPIRIGYAGRIVKYPKRLDLLIEVAKRLAEEKVDFRLEIAGAGEYEIEMKKSLINLLNRISFLGYLKRENMNTFWKNQDIGVNCSDYEGRCISKIESMVSGAVPIITDTSSARDDVQDGYNGYVVPIGDVDCIVNRICYLYNHRELLKIMGERSRQIVMMENEKNDINTMWGKILKR